METNPKIKLVLSPIDKKAELASIIFLATMWILALYTFLKSPLIIPTHFNFSGHADKYGNKWIIFLLPLLATLITLTLTQLCKYPHIFNYMTKITDANAQKQYTTATRMLRFAKLMILLIFFSIILFTYLTATAAT